MQSQNGSMNPQSFYSNPNMINPSQQHSMYSQYQSKNPYTQNIQYSNQNSFQQGNPIMNNQNTNPSPQIESSFPNQNNFSQSKIGKSSFKASRNKSPPQIMNSSSGKLIDNSGNDYAVFNNEEKDEEEIKKSVAKEFNNIVKKSMALETKKIDKTIGDGFRTFAQLTKGGKNQKGEKKKNQDTPLIHVNCGGISGFNLFGVLDGHGNDGHLVSQYCRNYFIKKMSEYAAFCKKKNLMTAEAIYNDLKQNKFSYIIDIFNKADIEMANQNDFDCSLSGTTCSLVIQLNKYLISASVGDSRAIVIEDKGDNKNSGIVQLSRDQRPDLPEEMKRIISSGGMVDKMTCKGEKVGPPRVWKKGDNYPGLSMSRTLGDLKAKKYGVIATPEIIEYKLNRNSRYLLLCSDGVWLYIPNEQVRDLGNIFYNKNDVGNFCTELVKFAIYSWEQNDIMRDDITVVCVYF